ncbi:MAG: 2-hydroxyacyl-CoA dehydratase, partial [Spirochaetales bacterium]|nr:2-hydroxyacyl-CoA dehydratase [Candidatus Physcosoma equi]
YLAVPDYMDRHTEGLRGTQLRLAHNALGLIVTDICDMLVKIFRADPAIGNDKEFNKKIVLFDENMMSTLMGGFPNLIWLSAEVPAIYTSSMLNQKGVTHYVDATHQYGVPSDVCPMPAAELGLAFSGDFPLIGSCAVQCNTTCDGSLMGNGLEAKAFKVPTFQLAVPIRHRQESVQEYAAEEVLNAIHFIEVHTGETFDWDAFFSSMERFNAENREFEEWLQISATDYPQVMGVTMALYRYGVYQAAGGRNEAFLKMDRWMTKMAQDAYEKKEMACREYRHRAITWGVQAAYYTAFPLWLQNCWGIAPVGDMLSLMSVKPVDTSDKHQALLDLALLYENMIMRNRSNGGYETGVEALWEYCRMLNADMVIMYCHIGCKSMSGYHGLFEEEARKRGIHFMWVNHNLMVPEDGPRKEMRQEVNRYMRSVLGEEPLDPSLEDFDDSNAW